MNWYISVDIPESAPMASGGLCGHGVRVKTRKRLVPCQAQSVLRNTATKCQPMTKTLVWPGAGRKDGLLNATHLWPRFLGLSYSCAPMAAPNPSCSAFLRSDWAIGSTFIMLALPIIVAANLGSSMASTSNC